MSSNRVETAEVQVENGSEAKDLIDLTKDAVVVDATIGKQKSPSEDKIDGADKEEAPGIGDLISAGEEKAKAEEPVAENGKTEEADAPVVVMAEQNGHSLKKGEKMETDEKDAAGGKKNEDIVEIIEVEEVENSLKRKSEGGGEEVAPPKVAALAEEKESKAAGEEA